MTTHQPIDALKPMTDWQAIEFFRKQVKQLMDAMLASAKGRELDAARDGLMEAANMLDDYVLVRLSEAVDATNEEDRERHPEEYDSSDDEHRLSGRQLGVGVWR